MELEVGMYVRTKITDNCNCVYIRKITEIDTGKALLNQICIDEDIIDGWGDERIWIDVEDISKASHNIIDLIEVGDYVNGYLVNEVYNPTGNEVFRIEIERDTLKGHIISDNSQIKSIVTKEQFLSMEYKVGEQ